MSSPESLITQLENRIGYDKVITDPVIIKSRRHDYWVLSHLKDYLDEAIEPAKVVVQPANVSNVQEILKLANENRTPVIPFGLGSGVCGGVVASNESILLDMSQMNSIREIDEVNLLASFDAGKNGLEAEQAVAKQGLTIGHWPQSIAVSSVGGWVATRASGQFSTGYGNIEDVVYSIEAVLPNGEIIIAGKAPRASSGPDLKHFLLGSEGTLAVITGVTFALRRAAAASGYSAFHAGSMAQGIAAQREIVQSGWLPPVMRQYDANEVRRSFAEVAKDDNALLFMVHEGSEKYVELEKAAVAGIATDAGLTTAPEDVVSGWLEHRNNVQPWEVFFEQNMIVDTIEISSKWDKIDKIYDEVIARLKEVPGVISASAHSSHVYRTGINLYFSFAAVKDSKKDLPVAYHHCWDIVMEVTAANGGGMSHHHGIGRIRKNHIGKDIGDSGISVLRALKKSIDPNNIMNPGVLLPDA